MPRKSPADRHGPRGSSRTRACGHRGTTQLLGTLAVLAIAALPAPSARAESGNGSPEAAPHQQPDNGLPDADIPETGRRPISDRFTFAWVTGFGYGFEMRPRTQGSDVADVRLLTLMPQARFELFDHSPRGRWYDGRLDFVFETELVINFVPTTGFGGAASAGLRYGFQNDRTWSPYMIGLLGIGGIDFDLVDQDDGFEFWLQFGLGMKRKLGPVALTADVRIYHISNAQTHLPNAGIDTILFTLGIETP